MIPLLVLLSLLAFTSTLLLFSRDSLHVLEVSLSFDLYLLWFSWIRDQQESEGVTPGEDVYIILRLDGRVRRSGIVNFPLFSRFHFSTRKSVT